MWKILYGIILDETATDEPTQDSSSVGDENDNDAESIDNTDDDSDFHPNEADVEDDLADDIADEQQNNIENPAILAASPDVDRNEPLRVIVEQPSSSRKRKRTPENWKRNIKSTRYNTGRVGKRSEQPRQIKERCHCKRKKCSTISDEHRQHIFNAFWGLGEQILRQNFIVSHARKVQKLRAKLGSTRGDPITYHLTDTEERDIAVCEKFFLNTLSISKQTVHYTLKISKNGTVHKPTKKVAANKISQEVVKSIKDHIESINKIESHYCRSTTKRQYFEAGLSIPKLYEMYKISEFHSALVKESFYSKIFNECFNIGFHIPKKDTCDTCDSFSKLEAEIKENPDRAIAMSEELREKKESHMRRKAVSRVHKEQDKAVSPGKITITFDLQQVLTCPQLFNGMSYYRRKLSCYNLTVYELQTGRGLCYTWHEGEGNRGANDIASCIVKYLQRIDDEGYNHVVMYSDTCGGQNRNKIFSAAMVHFLSVSKNISKIEHKYFESGHSQMECDSMHSAIEKAYKNKQVDLPCGFIEHMKQARRSRNYIVEELSHENFLDFKSLNDAAMKQDTFAGIINAHYFCYKKAEGKDPQIFMGREIGEEANELSFRKRGGRVCLATVKRCYDSALTITKEKKADLLAMLPHLSAKQMSTLFYNSLRTNND